MIYLLIAIVICSVSGYLFKIGCGTISIYRPNMMSIIFYYYLLLQCVVGSILIVNNWEGYNWELAAVTNQNVRIFGFWAVMYTMIMFPFGMLLSNVVFRQNNVKVKFTNYCTRSISVESIVNPKMMKYLLVCLSFISLMAVLYVIRTIGEIGLLKVFSTDSAAELAGFRMESGRGFSGNAFIRGFFALFLCPILCYVAYGYKLICNSKFNKCWFGIMFIASVLIITSNLEKAPLIVFLIGFLFFKIYQGTVLSKKLLVFCFILLVILISAIYILVMKTDSGSLAAGILNRLTISSVGGLYLDFDIFPVKHDFLGLSSFSQEINAFFGTPHNERSARIAMFIAQPELVKTGEAGVINCLFIGEAWANWGWTGLIISPIYVGFVIQSFYLAMLNLKKTPLFLAIMVKYSFASVIVGGINDYIYNTSVRWLLIICILFLLLSQLYKNKNNACNDCFEGYSV